MRESPSRKCETIIDAFVFQFSYHRLASQFSNIKTDFKEDPKFLNCY